MPTNREIQKLIYEQEERKIKQLICTFEPIYERDDRHYYKLCDFLPEKRKLSFDAP